MNRRGFSLLEVIIALAILVTSLVILADIETNAIEGSLNAQRVLTGTQLAQDKLSEARMRLEGEGFTEEDVCEEGDFDDLGQEDLNLEFGESLKEFHWQYCISEVDLATAGDLMGSVSSLAGTGLEGVPGAESNVEGNVPGLDDLGFSNDMLSDMLSKYLREVRVRIWWGEDSKLAEENGDEVVLVTHVANPTGAVVATGDAEAGGGTTSGGGTTGGGGATGTGGIGGSRGNRGGGR